MTGTTTSCGISRRRSCCCCPGGDASDECGDAGDDDGGGDGAAEDSVPSPSSSSSARNAASSAASASSSSSRNAASSSSSSSSAGAGVEAAAAAATSGGGASPSSSCSFSSSSAASASQRDASTLTERAAGSASCRGGVRHSSMERCAPCGVGKIERSKWATCGVVVCVGVGEEGFSGDRGAARTVLSGGGSITTSGTTTSMAGTGVEVVGDARCGDDGFFFLAGRGLRFLTSTVSRDLRALCVCVCV